MNTEQERAELLPCPCCGGEAAFNTTRTTCRETIKLNKRDTGYGVNCVVCGINNRGLVLGYESKALAAEAWNRRAALQSQPIESAAREIALWAYGEVGADPELTPGLAQLLHHFGISDDVPVALQSQDRMKDQLNLVISKADKARSERTTEVVTCITKARKDEVRDRSGFATEMADQYGFAFIDDDAEYMVCNTESLTDLMSVLGFRTSEERHNVTIPANTALTDEEIQTLWMNVATFDAHLADVLAISRAVERAAIEAYRKRSHSEAQEVCAEAYQVVGSLLSDLGIFETEKATKILDNLSQASLVHKDVLPWGSDERRSEPVGYLIDLDGRDTYISADRAVRDAHIVYGWQPLYTAPQPVEPLSSNPAGQCSNPETLSSKSAEPTDKEFLLVDEPTQVPSAWSKGTRYKVEPHGDGYAIYRGRDQSHHGLNLAHITECTNEFAERIEAALNGAHPTP